MFEEKKYFEGISSYKFLAKKEVGQNFLIDSSIAQKIVALLEAAPQDLILEIGPGAGSLTYFLARGPAQCLSVDIDEGFLSKIEEDFLNNRYVTPLLGNALTMDMTPYSLIIGNLPYYITSSLVEKILLGAPRCRRAVIMVQKEAADRFLPNAKKAAVSPLGLYLNYVATVKRKLSVPRRSFVPAPHVDSCVLTIDFDLAKHDEAAQKAYLLAQKLFASRRKSLLNNLKALLKDPEKAEAILKKADIQPLARPEEVGFPSYLTLSKLLDC